MYHTSLSLLRIKITIQYQIMIGLMMFSIVILSDTETAHDLETGSIVTDTPLVDLYLKGPYFHI